MQDEVSSHLSQPSLNSHVRGLNPTPYQCSFVYILACDSIVWQTLELRTNTFHSPYNFDEDLVPVIPLSFRGENLQYLTGPQEPHQQVQVEEDAALPSRQEDDRAISQHPSIVYRSTPQALPGPAVPLPVQPAGYQQHLGRGYHQPARPGYQHHQITNQPLPQGAWHYHGQDNSIPRNQQQRQPLSEIDPSLRTNLPVGPPFPHQILSYSQAGRGQEPSQALGQSFQLPYQQREASNQFMYSSPGAPYLPHLPEFEPLTIGQPRQLEWQPHPEPRPLEELRRQEFVNPAPRFNRDRILRWIQEVGTKRERPVSSADSNDDDNDGHPTGAKRRFFGNKDEGV